MELVLLDGLFSEGDELLFGLSLILWKGHPLANDFAARLVIFFHVRGFLAYFLNGARSSRPGNINTTFALNPTYRAAAALEPCGTVSWSFPPVSRAAFHWLAPSWAQRIIAGESGTREVGGSSLEASAPLGSASLKTKWPHALNGMNGDLLDGRTSSTNRASASDFTIKISASIATTLGSKPNSHSRMVELSFAKTVIGSTTLARLLLSVVTGRGDVRCCRPE
jgi:hypothetical protein